MIGIVDYNAGNIRSVERALDALKIEYLVSKNPADLRQVDKVIFPGVGEASYAMSQLKKSGFDSFLKDFAATGKPLLGICLGSQIIFEYSEEGDTACLGLLTGNIRHFNSILSTENKSDRLKIPHMGWNSLKRTEFGNGKTCSSLFDGTGKNPDMYFVHSYVIQPKDSGIVAAVCDYGIQVPAVISCKNISAFQFHPEKSGEEGLRLLRNFGIGQKNGANGEHSC